MADKSGIQWTDATWNPTTGCDQVSPGCDHCYALTLAKRLKAMGSPAYQEDGDPRTSGPGFKLQVHPSRLDQPIRWTRPRRIFVNSMSDLFHADVPDSFIAQVWAAMALAPHHTFQVLTKRHGRLRSLLSDPLFKTAVHDEAYDAWRPGCPEAYRSTADALQAGGLPWPLPHVWVGVSVEDQKRADLRIPALLDTPAAVRFLSCEPLLGPVDLARWLDPERECRCMVPPMEGAGQHAANCRCLTQPEIGWVIAGGESGPGARAMDLDWVRALRDQTQLDQVAFHYKQQGTGDGGEQHRRELDGRTWDQWPVEQR